MNLFKHPQSGYNSYDMYNNIITLFLKTYFYKVQSIVEFVKFLKS